MSCDGTFNLPGWTKEQDKAFEGCLALYAGEPNDRWEKIAAALTGKTREEIRHHYQLLVEDLNAIESGCVPLPCYADSAADSTNHKDDPLVCEKESQPAKPVWKYAKQFWSYTESIKSGNGKTKGCSLDCGRA